MEDVNMKQASLDDLIKQDKKLGRVRQPNIRGGRPLPGRGRGGRGRPQNALDVRKQR